MAIAAPLGGRGIGLLTKDEATELLTSAVVQLHDAVIHATGSSVVDSYRRVAARLAEAAREQVADAIVLGSHRRRRVGRLFSTQVREQTTRLTELPVLTAPSPLEIMTRGRAETSKADQRVREARDATDETWAWLLLRTAARCQSPQHTNRSRRRC